MQGINLTLSGRATQGLLPVAAGDLVPLGYLQSQMSGVMPLGGPVLSAQITDLAPAVLGILAASGFNSGTGTPAIFPGGGLILNSGLLAADSGVVSFVGHTHQAADIVDLPSAVAGLLPGNLVAGSGVSISGAGPVTIGLNLAPAAGLLFLNSGLGIDFGTGTNQSARGDHTHAQLHNPLTLGYSSSVSGTLAGQQLSLAVITVPGGGLLTTPSGLAVDPAVVQLVSDLAPGFSLTVLSTPTVGLSLNSGVLSAAVPLDPNPPAMTGGVILAGVNGLYVSLGSGTQQAAPGTHVHNPATESADGFMSATDKTRLDTLWSDPSGLTPVATTTLVMGLTAGQISGTVQYNSNPLAGHGALGSDAGGLYVVLGSGTNVAAPGNVIAAALGLHSGIANAVNAAGNPPTQTEFNNLVATVNQVLGLLRAMGLPG